MLQGGLVVWERGLGLDELGAQRALCVAPAAAPTHLHKYSWSLKTLNPNRLYHVSQRLHHE